jgi:hypothetical protein
MKRPGFSSRGLSVGPLCTVRAVPRTIATNTTVTRGELLEFLRSRRNGILVTSRADGAPQLSAVTYGVDPQAAGTAVEVPPAVCDAVGGRVRGLGAPFVTTDLAMRSDGVWRVIEVGDGQVSDLPAAEDPARLIQALAVAC